MHKQFAGSAETGGLSFPEGQRCGTGSNPSVEGSTPVETRVFDNTAILDFQRAGEAFSTRFPSDTEWLSYYRSLEMYVKPKPGGGEIVERRRETFATQQLLQQIAVDRSFAPTKETAVWIVDSLCGEFVGTEITRGCIVVKIRFLKFWESVHRLRFPTAFEDRELRATIRNIPSKNGWQRRIQDIEKFAALYDELAIDVRGYKRSAPLGHKVGVVSNVIVTAQKEAA